MKIEEELKKITIVGEDDFTNVWELLQWYDAEQSVADLFDYTKQEKPEDG